jgi:hypothetical protein
MFTWVEPYRQMAEALLAYEDRQQELIAILRELRDQGHKVVQVNDRDEAGEARHSVRLYLVYPKSETFTEPRDFRFSTEPVFRITAVPFDLAGALDGIYAFRVDTTVSALDLEGTVPWKGSLDEVRQLR